VNDNFAWDLLNLFAVVFHLKLLSCSILLQISSVMTSLVVCKLAEQDRGNEVPIIISAHGWELHENKVCPLRTSWNCRGRQQFFCFDSCVVLNLDPWLPNNYHIRKLLHCIIFVSLQIQTRGLPDYSLWLMQGPFDKVFITSACGWNCYNSLNFRTVQVKIKECSIGTSFKPGNEFYP